MEVILLSLTPLKCCTWSFKSFCCSSVCVCSGMAPSENSVAVWSCKQVAQWLQEEGFGEYVELLCSQHRLDGPSLLALTEADLRGPPLGLNVLGDIKRLTMALRRLRRQNQAELEELGLQHSDSLPSGLSSGSEGGEWGCDRAERRCNGADRLFNGTELRLRNGDRSGYGLGATLCHTHSNWRYRQHLAGRLDPEVWKTVMSCIYVFCVFGFTSVVMVFVHERVPDMRTYPPLPDIFLDRYTLHNFCLYSTDNHQCISILRLYFNKIDVFVFSQRSQNPLGFCNGRSVWPHPVLYVYGNPAASQTQVL